MDLNGDGDKDLLSGSYGGKLYYFQNSGNGSFGDRQELKTNDGETIKLGAGGTVCAADWDRDGDLDLVTGNMWGPLYRFLNESDGNELTIEKGLPLDLVGTDGKPIEGGYPCVADWDGDGRHDLLLGSTDGSVSFYRNLINSGEPHLAPPVELVPPSPDYQSVLYTPDQDPIYGTYSRICVCDWNGDGRMDLIMGVTGRTLTSQPELSEDEKVKLKEAAEEMLVVGEKYNNLMEKGRQKVREEMGISTGENLDVSRAYEIWSKAMIQMMNMSEFIQINQKLMELYSVTYKYNNHFSSHGWVWVFLRK